MRRLLIILIALTILAITIYPAAAQSEFADTILLPVNFRPEGIVTGRGLNIYAGSLRDGTILEADMRTGETRVVVEGRPGTGTFAVGLGFDRRSGYLFVAGGGAGVSRVYDSATGELLATYEMRNGGEFGDFINDVVVTRDAAYFTNSFAPVYYRVPLGERGELPGESSAVEMLELSGDWSQLPGQNVFNSNGIEARWSGSDMLIVNSSTQTLYHIEPESGFATRVDMGGEAVPNGDGLVWRSRTLYVVQNQRNQVAVITLDRGLRSGTFEEPIVNEGFVVPTTAAIFGRNLFVVNAKFGFDPTVTAYEIIRVPSK